MLPIISVAISATILRIYLVFRDSVPFALDMARDLLWSKDITFYGVPTLLGPWASIWGVYFPPFWFYFLSIPLRFTNGHPLSAVLATSATIIATGVLAFIFFKKIISNFYALSLSIIILFSATLINISTFAFHANVLPILTLLFIYCLYLAKVKNPQFFAISSFLTGLMYSADPAPAVVMSFVLVVLFLYLKLQKSKSLKKLILISSVSYIVPLLPNVLFELRNNLVQSQALLAYFRGENPSLSGQLPILERVINRVDLFFDFLKISFAGNNIFFTFLIITLLLLGIYKFSKIKHNQNLDILLKINLIIIVVSFSVLTLVLNVEIKNWYLYGLTVPVAILIAFAILGFNNKILTVTFLVTMITVNLLPFFQKQRTNFAMMDPAQLKNQIETVDLIYQDAKNFDFSVYVFTPAIYDYPYQYLFWWQGQAKGRGLPADFAYLPNQPDYIKNKNIYTPKALNTDSVYLIMENALENEFYTKADWLKNFQDYDLIWEKDINSAITLQKRVMSIK